MKQLAKGILVGSLATVAAIASGVLTFHKTVIKPVSYTHLRAHETS